MAILDFLLFIGYFAHSISGEIAKITLLSQQIAVRAHCDSVELYVALMCCEHVVPASESDIGAAKTPADTVRTTYKIMCAVKRNPETNEEMVAECEGGSPPVSLNHCLREEGDLIEGVTAVGGGKDIPKCQIVPLCHMEPLNNNDNVLKMKNDELPQNTDWNKIKGEMSG